MQYLITAFVFCISKPFKSPIYTNYFLTFFMIFGFAYSCVIILWEKRFISHLLQLFNFHNQNDSFFDYERNATDFEIYDEVNFEDPTIKYYIQGIALLNFILSYLFEKVIVPVTTGIWNANKIRKLKELKKKETEHALTMQQLFQISE